MCLGTPRILIISGGCYDYRRPLAANPRVSRFRVRRQRQEEQEHGREERLKKQVLIITVR